MASSSKPEKIYDVFLSFRGVDLRNNFIGHLYQALHRIGIYTFRDNEELKKGDQISPVLMKAIEESYIAIIVFSVNYASSRWCLEEVAKIIECKEEKNLIVLPVFYKVDPREVRGCRKSYQRALAKHESKFGKDSEKVKRWKEALSDAGKLSGWHLNDGDESELIQEIVEKISTYLAQTPLHVAKHPVGIDSRVAKLKSMLNLESDDGVLMVGIWGQGGIGKTSLAKALYNVIFRKFEGSCFLENVRETSEGTKSLVTLQEILLNDILLPKQRLEVSNVDRGIQLIQRRLGRKKVLLILDDADDLRQLNTLAEGKWFGNGSRIIITTRNKHLLDCHQIDQDHVYKVEALDDSQAHDLLTKHALQTHQIRIDLVDSALNYAKGLPLALEVLGSLLCGTTEDVWESTLMKLSRIPDKKINNVLKVSYDGLDENEKEIFLHIACFFNGRTREYTKKVLDSCDLLTVVGFDTLIKRSLIRFELGILKVHNLIQAMGKDIVNQECRDDPGRRSRLWLYDDVANVLSHDMGDCAIKAIVLELPEPIEMHISPEAFTKMRRLRLLILHNVQDSFQGPICLPNELRWFEWSGCTHQIPEFSAGPKKLVGLDMSKGNITGVLKQFKDFQNLKYATFSYCEGLVRIPDLSYTPNLKKLDFRDCKNLVEVHKSLAYHDKLQVLIFSGCYELSAFPNELKSKNIQILNFTNCTKFERFPDIPHKLEALNILSLDRTAIKELPTSIENLTSLKLMYLNRCKNLVSLPSSIYKLQNLGELEVSGCTNLVGFPKYEDLADPCMKTGLSKLYRLDLSNCNLSEVEFFENLSCFPLLESFILEGNNIIALPSSINKRDHLSFLYVGSCHHLQKIPELPAFLNFFADHCESLQKNEDLSSIHQLVGKSLADGLDTHQNQSFDRFLFEREMPQWVFPIEGDSISFMVSKDLYDKILGLASCVILDNVEYDIEILSHVDGKSERKIELPFIYPLHPEHLWLNYTTRHSLWAGVDFDQIDGNYVEFSLTHSIKVKKWGIRIICKQLGNDLKVELQDNRLIDLALLYEVGHEPTNSTAGSSLMHEDNSSEIDLHEDLQDCQVSGEEQSQMVPKKNHELFSLEACEPRSCGLLVRLVEMSIAVFARCFCC
ncbi:disease resistance protein RUN1 isoform X1 [Eucalyptus grandis]|uniref:disease resistance protein RUN1 isoform X1 n=1 Tax=Eucalyptus grandis TaxID=71139 RepID=UPI00192EC4F6|nr:disease resistance protein RUN1 isoform X1 [Eucalyptus grandis]XP_039168933.1 disease resistance protein RUN1 isoform X1 [Eucalyptus grandis]XP_039168934.1 disease resistance protein RUN1 isoform X1 [Eucalyptus grandis]